MAQKIDLFSSEYLYNESPSELVMDAASDGDCETLAKLIDTPEGRNAIDDRDIKEFTPLILASSHGNFGAVELLIKAGANVNKSANYGRTPLMYAASNGHLDCLRILIEARADINQVDDDVSLSFIISMLIFRI